MDYVGIRNSPEKAELLDRGRVRAGEAGSDELSFDCLRHLDFLERATADGEASFPRTLYWKYLRSAGRNEESALARCRGFLDLYAEIRQGGYDWGRGRIAVTEDGIRLNGSHRAAIARFLGRARVPVDVYRWEDRFPPRRVRAIRAEAEAKRRGQRRCVGRAADDPAGAHVGTVVFVDARPRSGLQRLLAPAKMELVLAVETDEGELVFRREEELSLR